MPNYNVVLLTVDSWNRNFVGCYNAKAQKENITPKLDEWSKNSVIFTSAFSPSVKTSASFPGILSGRFPSKYGDWFTSLSDSRVMISEILHDRGYITYGFTSNPCTSSLRRYDRGFDVFRDDNVLKTKNKLNLTLKLALKTVFEDLYTSADKLSNQVLSTLNMNNLPYFLWVHYMDIHGPYIPTNGSSFKNRILATKIWKKATKLPAKVTENEIKILTTTYKEKSRFLDYHLTDLIKKLDDDNTMIILTADHGDVFGERGYFGHPFIFYNEMINVPLFMKFPTEMEIANKRFAYAVSLLDIAPTIVDVIGSGKEKKFDGDSLLPLLFDKEEKYKQKYIISEISREYVCVVRGKWKLIVNYGINSYELYDLEHDNEERNNLIKERADVAEDLERVIKAHIIENKPE